MISICIPYVRPHLMQDLIHKINIHSGINAIEILAEEDVNRIGCPKLLKKLVDKAKGDYIAFLGDDTDPQPNFLRHAMCNMNHHLSGSGLVGFNDKTGRSLPIHWVADRLLLDMLDGEFFHIGYNHAFCDVELRKRCEEKHLYYHSESAIVLHNHPQWDRTIKRDEHYLRAYNKVLYRADRALFAKRKNNNWR